MIIDAHVHIGKLQSLDLDGSIDFLLKMSEKYNIDRMFCTSITALFYDSKEGNKEIYQLLKKYPKKIIGYATISSSRFGSSVVDEIDKCINCYGMKGLKIYSITKGFGSFEPWISISEPGMAKVFEKAIELDIPVLAHSTPQECEAVSEMFPDLKLMMAHMGNTMSADGDWNRALMAAKKYKNIILDTTASTIDYDFIETAVKEVGSERIVFGTDFPLINFDTAICRINEANISNADKENIFYKNILRLIGERIDNDDRHK